MESQGSLRKTDGGRAQPAKVITGTHHREAGVWERFDRLQRSLRPLRKGNHPRKGLHYGGT